MLSEDLQNEGDYERKLLSILDPFWLMFVGFLCLFPGYFEKNNNKERKKEEKNAVKLKLKIRFCSENGHQFNHLNRTAF